MLSRPISRLVQAPSPSSKVALQYLRYVLAAAEKRSFRQAAIELGVWESTISRGIRDLEDEIGVALFNRLIPAALHLLMRAPNS